jgi:hypothetical protein
MNRKIVNEVIFEKTYSGEIRYFKVSDLPLDILPTDKIEFWIEEGYYSENNSCDASTHLNVIRDRIETDEEFEKRKKFWADKQEEGRKVRYEQYLKLKKEFEDGIN